MVAGVREVEPTLMPLYEVRRRTVLASATVTAANETEARCLARDAWQQDAALAALGADVLRVPFPPDDTGDLRSELRYEETDHDRMSEETERIRREDYSESP